MFKNEKLFKLAKIAFCLLLILSLIVGCGKEKTPSNKKKVIKKVIVVQDEDTDTQEDDNTNQEVSSLSASETTDTRKKRELYKYAKDVETVSADVVEPEYVLKAYDWAGPDGYVIVYPKSDKLGGNAAIKIQEYFKSQAGVTLSVVDDSTAACSKEILVGNTNRMSSNLETNEYAVILADDKLIFEGGHSVMVGEAVKWFISAKFSKGKVNLLSGECKNFSTVVKEKYRYVWGDEFGGTALDMDKWSFQNRMSGTNLMPAISDSNVVNVNDGLLKMTAVRYYDASRPMAQYATNLSISSEKSMSYKYGYLEMRAMVPFNRGAWPSFWMVSDGAIGNEKSMADYFVEVDIFEIFSSINKVTPNIHKWYKDNSHSQFNGEHYAEKKSTDYVFKDYDNLRYEYHIYGFEWTPEKMVMSVDGVDYNTYDLKDNFDAKSDMSGFHDNLFLMFNNYIYVSDYGGTSASTEVNNKDLPFEFFVDYIRLYQKSGEGALNFAN